MEDPCTDPDDPRRFAGQPWEVWAEHLGRWSPVPDPPLVKQERGVTLLPREDMGLYGFCPEWDPFYTVVCELCKKVVKPQGLSRHYDLWHPEFKVSSSRPIELADVATASSSTAISTSMPTPTPVPVSTAVPTPVPAPTSVPMPITVPTSVPAHTPEPMPITPPTPGPMPIPAQTPLSMPIPAQTPFRVSISAPVSTSIPASTFISTPILASASVPLAISTPTSVPTSVPVATPVPMSVPVATPVPTPIPVPVPVSTSVQASVSVSTHVSAPITIAAPLQMPMTVPSPVPTNVSMPTQVSAPIPVLMPISMHAQTPMPTPIQATMAEPVQTPIPKPVPPLSVPTAIPLPIPTILAPVPPPLPPAAPPPPPPPPPSSPPPLPSPPSSPPPASSPPSSPPTAPLPPSPPSSPSPSVVPVMEETIDPPEDKIEVVELSSSSGEGKIETWSPLRSASSSPTSPVNHINEAIAEVIPEVPVEEGRVDTNFIVNQNEEVYAPADSPKDIQVHSPKEKSSMEPVVVVTRLPSPSKLPNYMAKFGCQAKLNINNSNTNTNSNSDSDSMPTPKKRFKPDRKFPVKEKEYDPDKHCGVWIEDQKKFCTRSLTCKSHGLSLRRAVIGRTKSFDRLLSEHRTAKESKIAAKESKQAAKESRHVARGGLQASKDYKLTEPENKLKKLIEKEQGFHCGGRSQIDPPTLEDIMTDVRFQQTLPPCLSPRVVLCSLFPRTSGNKKPTPLPDLSLNTFESRTHSRPTVGTGVVSRFTPEVNHSPRPAEDNVMRFTARMDDMNWRKTHPRPYVVPGLIARKCGGILWSGRRIGLFRHGLQTALTQGYIRIPLSNDYFGVPLQYPTNHATSTMKTVLTNISTKGNMLNVSNKLLGPNCTSKSLQVTTNSPRKLNQIHSALSATIMNSSSLKTVLPKPSVLAAKSVNHSNNLTELNVKNGQFHVPNILSASLKRPLETIKSNAGVSVKRSKRKNCVNPNEVLSSLLARKNHISSASNTVPLVTVALSNGVTVGNTGAGQVEGSETKTIFTSRSVVVPEGLLSELPKAITSNSVATLPETGAGNSAIKAAQATAGARQSLHITAAPSAVQVATPQITYLTAGPVTFQQIPVLSSQVISQIQLQSKSGNNPSSIPLKLLSQSSGVGLSAPRSVVVHSELEQATTET